MNDRSLKEFKRDDKSYYLSNAKDYLLEFRFLELQTYTLKFMLWLFAINVFFTYLIVFLQGFNIGGFQLPAELLNWLGAAVIGEVVTILTLLITCIFKRKEFE